MSVLVERAMGELDEGQKAVYPLFQKPLSKSLELPSQPELTHNVAPITKTTNSTPKNATKSNKRASKPKIVLGDGASTTQGNAELLEVDPNSARRKRQKTASPDGDTDWAEKGNSRDMETNGQDRSRRIGRTRNSTLNFDSILGAAGSEESLHATHGPGPDIPPMGDGLEPSPKAVAIDLMEVDAQVQPSTTSESWRGSSPKEEATLAVKSITPPTSSAPTLDMKAPKVLRFNPKTGTIGSPPRIKDAILDKSCNNHARKRGRPRKSTILTIRYSSLDRFSPNTGQKIAHILGGLQNTVPPTQPQTIRPLEVKKPPLKKPAKSVHPLFLGKAARVELTKSKDSKANQVPVIDLTEMKADPLKVGPQLQDKRTFFAQKSSFLKSAHPTPTGAIFTGFGASSKLTKFPGAVEPAWPWKGMVHIRGEDAACPKPYQASHNPSQGKKSKGSATEVHGEEDVLSNLARSLNVPDVLKTLREIDLDQSPLPPTCLRAPTKHNESGRWLQERARRELSCSIPPPTAFLSSSEDEITTRERTQTKIHPALLNMYSAIPSSHSAFDQGKCENHDWVDKYSPNCAAEVLQTGREALILKEWLQTLTVKSVEAGIGEKAKTRASSTKQSKADSGKRKRKTKLDGFIVDSGDEDDEMDEISEPEDEIAFWGPKSAGAKTVVRKGDAKASKDTTKLTNAVVISGPHGAGKSAAVYAVAKELAFEVFEINSSNRRSGKDILEKVGDMTRNHLVQGSGTTRPVEVLDDDKQRIDDALASDLRSGRQGTMISFFKAQPTAVPKAIKVPKNPVTATENYVQKDGVGFKAPAKDQKQSLILIEEADILFKEDTQFWATIMSLILTSKRPIIMTCNDESALPLGGLALHAIIRFKPPPSNLAADYLLLVAACEGHLIKHEAVKTLYEGRSFDLRASLTELNFWCQFAVADPKRGLDWYPETWPPGRNMDKDGNLLRVVSEGTYETGMGWLSQDFVESNIPLLDVEEELLHQTLDGWNIDSGDWSNQLDLDSWAQNVQQLSHRGVDNRAALDMYCDFAEHMSVVDLCSAGTFAPKNKLPLDPSIPELTPKAREDYTLALELIEAHPLVIHTTLDASLSIFLKSRSRNYFQIDQHLLHNLEVTPLLDPPNEQNLLSQILTTQTSCTPFPLIRQDFSLAFDPISECEKAYPWSLNPSSLEASSFDRTLTLIVEDLAPYVRGIVAFDKRLAEERRKMSGLLSQGGSARAGKRMRTTRAAMSALEGGERKSTRKEKWFGERLNGVFVERTGKGEWIDAAVFEEKSKRKELCRGMESRCASVSVSVSAAGSVVSEMEGSERDELS